MSPIDIDEMEAIRRAMGEEDSTKGTSWRYLSDEEAEEMISGSVAVNDKAFEGRELAEAERAIFHVMSSGYVRDREGKEVLVSAGEPIKILPADYKDEEWVYEVVNLLVRVPGGDRATLRAGVKVAVLPSDYAELMERRNDASARDKRGASPEISH